MRTVFFAFAFFLAGIRPALGSPLDNAHTHHTALTAPELSVSSASFKMARTWFLPDWQAGMATRTDTVPAGSEDGRFDCERNGYSSSPCVAPQVKVKEHNMVTHVCYECACPTTYQYTSCASGYVLAGGSCNGKYLRCDTKACPSGYTAGKTCASGYDREVNGKSGSQDCARCVAKGCPSGYSAGLSNCNGQSYPEGWTYSSNGYAGNSICGKCTAKTCASGYTSGLASCNGQSQPSGWTYVSNGYAGNSVCGKCTAKSCPAGYTAGVTQCSNTTSWTYGSNGYAGNSICGKCTSKDCASGYTAGLANCNGKAHPAGWSYTAGTPSGNTVCGRCTAKSCTAGSTSCNSSTQNATANGYYAGDSVCYTCTAKSCEQMGQKTCNGACIAKTACCNCSSSQKCVSGSCVAKTCADAGGPACPAGYACQAGTCIAQSCEAQGKKTCNGSCIATSQCCTDTDCSANQKCAGKSCVAKTCADGGYQTSCVPGQQAIRIPYAGLTCYSCRQCNNNISGIVTSAVECRKVGGFCRNSLCQVTEITIGNCQGNLVCCARCL